MRDYSDILEMATELTENDTKQAMEAFIHNMNTLHSRAGSQVPFSSINFGTDTSEEGRMVIKQLLDATDAGLGHGETPIFPISIFKLKSGVNFNKEDKNYDLFKQACKVSARRLFPNFSNLDVGFNSQYYKPGLIETEATYMGCVEGREVITYKVDGKLYVEGIKRAFERFESTCQTKKYGITEYIDIEGMGVEIYDSNKKGFTKCKKIMRNPNRDNWLRLKLENGRCLELTEDHPLSIVGKGRTFAADMEVGDSVEVTYEQFSEEKNSFDDGEMWLKGLLLCDSSYANNVMVSLGEDELDIVEKLKDEVSRLGYSTSVKHQDRGNKGRYIDVNIKCGRQLKYFRGELENDFGGKVKSDRSIPNYVFSTSRSNKLAFLAGMMDADGYCAHHRDGREKNTTSMTLGSTNKELALQQMALIQSLGYACKVYMNYYKKGSSDIRYLLNFSFIEELAEKMASRKKASVLENGRPSKLIVEKSCKIVEIEKVDIDKESYDVETESDRFDVSGILSHNCRTRVMGNVYDPTREVVTGRGNLSFTSINLPRLALMAGTGNIDGFFELLDDRMYLVKRQLLERLAIQSKKKPINYPFLMGQGVWIDSDKLGPVDDISEVLKHGSLTIGFIGLAETLKGLVGSHHGESAEAQELGLKIIGHMRELADSWAKAEKLNWTIIGTPAEGLSGRFVAMDRKRFGKIPGVTDREYYTNSSHVPVYYPISAFKKIKIEAPYHTLCNAGHICYVELDGDPTENLEAFEKVVRYMQEQGVGYGAINHPVDRDPVCGYVGIIGNTCPRCGREEGKPMTEETWQRIKGYAGVGNAENLGYHGNVAEEFERNINPMTISEDK